MMSADVHTLEGGNLVYILESSVDDGNHHGLAPQAYVVQTLSLQGGNLVEGLSIELAMHTVARLELIVILGLEGCGTDGVGRLPHQLCGTHTRQLCQSLKMNGVAHSH